MRMAIPRKNAFLLQKGRLSGKHKLYFGHFDPKTQIIGLSTYVSRSKHLVGVLKARRKLFLYQDMVIFCRFALRFKRKAGKRLFYSAQAPLSIW